MLACIACSKQPDDGPDDSTARAATRSGKDAVKSLASQIKDLVLKFSGSHRQSKAGSFSTSYRSKSVCHRGGPYHRYLDDCTSDVGQYTYLRSSSSTPAWDFTSINHETELESRHKPMGILATGLSPEEVVVLEDNSEPKEWMAQVEPGVHITFVSLPGGDGNDLKRIRFSREMFNKWQAQRWWGENYDRIMELYNVQRFSSQVLPTPPRSDDAERDSCYSRVGSTRDSPITPGRNKDPFFPDTTSTKTRKQTAISGRGAYFPSVPDPTGHIFQNHHFHPVASVVGGGGSSIKGEGTSSIDASRTTTSSREEASISVSNASDVEVTEWVEQDEPGVYITIRELPDGTRELRRVRFSRERFGEVRAKRWWEENRERIQAQYL